MAHRKEIIELTAEELRKEREKSARLGAEAALEKYRDLILETRRYMAAQVGKVDRKMLADLYGISVSQVRRWLKEIGAEEEARTDGPTEKTNWYDLETIKRLDREHNGRKE